MCIKFYGLIFHDFDWQENSWGINFNGHGGVVGTIVVRFAKYASYCGLSFVDKRYTMKSIHLKNFYACGIYFSLINDLFCLKNFVEVQLIAGCS